MSRYQLLHVCLALIVTLVVYTGDCQNNRTGAEKTMLRLLVYGPYPNDGGWDGGIALIPAVRLAFNQINNNSNILEGYQLEAVEGDSGCQVETTAIRAFLDKVFYSSYNIVGAIGPGCSRSTILLAPTLSRPEISLVQIAPTATSPEIEEIDQNTTFTLRVPRDMITNTVALLKAKNWQRCATLYDQERSIHTTLHEAFVAQASRDNISVGFTASIVDETLEQIFPLDRVQDSRQRIVVLFSESITAQRVMCIAFHKSMIYPTYQWIIVEKHLNTLNQDLEPFKVHNEMYNCTREEMSLALSGTIITQYTLNRTNETQITPLDITYADYREQYQKELEQHLNEPFVQKRILAANRSKEYYIRDDNWENVYYDAAWAFALALDGAAKRHGVNLAGYRYGQVNTTAILLEEFSEVEFEGSSGYVKFTSAQNVLSPIVTKQIIHGNHTTVLCNRTQGVLNCSKDGFIAINDSFGENVDRIHVALGVLLILVTIILTTLTVCLHTLFVLFGDRKSVKATSPDISHLIFSGCYLYCIATIVYTLQQMIPFDSEYLPEWVLYYSISCNAVVWCVILGASLMFGTMFVKVWRIFKLFRHFRNKRPGYFLSDRALVLAVLILVALDCAFCICWSMWDPYVMNKIQRDFEFDIMNGKTNIEVNLQCQCENSFLWIGIAIGLKGPIILLLVIFATLNRKINRKHFAHTKKVNILVYCLTVICGVGFATVIILSSNPNLSVYVSVLLCAVLLAPVVLCCLLLFIPPLLQLNAEPQSPSRSSRTSRVIRKT